MVAQKHPGDFDGIVANAPALYWPSLLVALGWVQFTMRWLNHQVPQCVLNEFSQASVKACDGLDGVIDDVVSNPDACNFDPYSIVGDKANCTPTQVTITDEDAQVVEAIMGGPISSQGTKLWETWHWGTSYTSLASPPESLNLWDSWIRIAVNKDADYDINNYRNLSQLVDHFAVSQAEFDGLIVANDPDLSAFRDRGGKLLTWHGMADGIIPANNTVRYRREVEQVMGGNARVDDFYRLFLVPGAGHCNAGNGAYPADALDSLIAWVEEGKAPDTLQGEISDGKGKPAERIMCPYPHVALYDGKGNPRQATSYTCAKEHAHGV